MSILIENSTTNLDLVLPQSDAKTEFRNYVDSERQNTVADLYYENHKNQTVEFVLQQKEKYSKMNGPQMSIWNAIVLLNELVDNSDPDTSLPQIIHLLQTAEAIRKAYPGQEYDWFHLVGLIHDLGKILSHPRVYNEPQWTVVGDTFPVGCEFVKENVFPEYFVENPDSQNPRYNTRFGIYSEGIGFDNCHFSFGHDEYMYMVCKANNCTLPPQALYIIRYHSFYPQHQKSAYEHLATDYDREMMKWVREFQKFDLYSKLPEKPDVEQLTPYYKSLVEKYFPPTLRW